MTHDRIEPQPRAASGSTSRVQRVAVAHLSPWRYRGARESASRRRFYAYPSRGGGFDECARSRCLATLRTDHVRHEEPAAVRSRPRHPSFPAHQFGGVYGAQPTDLDIIPETYHGMPDPLHAANAYGVAKRQAEHLCALYADRFGIEPVIARCFAFVGEDLPLDVHFAIGNFIRDALFRDEITVNGDGSPIRSTWTRLELARWLLVMLRHGEAGRAYNVGGQDSSRCSMQPDSSAACSGTTSRSACSARPAATIRPAIATSRIFLGQRTNSGLSTKST